MGDGMIAALIFYMFAAIGIASAMMVVSARNPVHSVLFLVLTFFNGAGLFLLLGAEFLAMLLVIVYVGAVAVLFLFVVMMLDINTLKLREGFMQYLPNKILGQHLSGALMKRKKNLSLHPQPLQKKGFFPLIVNL